MEVLLLNIRQEIIDPTTRLIPAETTVWVPRPAVSPTTGRKMTVSGEVRVNGEPDLL
jgi:hypothetical protein